MQADLKTFAAYRVHGLSAIAALTAQNTRGVRAVHVPPAEFLRAQIDAVFADFRIEVVKLGMLANAAVIEAVAEALDAHRPPHLVLDPVMVATSGARLLEPAALDALRTCLVPRATVLTPNVPEAELLLGARIAEGSAAAAVDGLLAFGSRAVLLKGGHLPGPMLVDYYGQGASRATFAHHRLDREGHGTGCTLASAVAANLAHGVTLLEACEDAIDYVHGALEHGYRPGSSAVVVLDHLWRAGASATND